MNEKLSKTNLMDLSLLELEEFFLTIGEKKFRARQVFRWIHIYGANNFDDMTDIAKTLRLKLKEIASIDTPVLIHEHKATDGVIKWILAVGDDGNKIETVFIPEENRGTLCISSQVGCALLCHFCSTARQGFNRNLTTGEIVSQLWWANKRLGVNSQADKIITNVVMMGMGEPLANYNNVINAMQIMLNDNAYNLSKKKLTLSTSGVVPNILRLIDDCPVALAISLHAPNDELRTKIIPLNAKYPIHNLIDSCIKYVRHANSPKEYITFEYVMLKNINDSLEHAKELAELLKVVPCKINLIPFNPFPNSGFECSSRNQIFRFQRILQDEGFIVTIRKTRGDDIDAACGQLVGVVNDKTKRSIKIVNILNNA